ncbi:VPLPA-CTERM sorting domain-containing protein [Rhodovulum strictum]|uniref:VPLPA-CTERM sorting domain-containing protein n=1 Tax=Rhodovulum strictum TaxID=58314 RepID=UPI001FEB7151|nr:VPLPA-CTERM sorting domain-containing protein [Rhodovulum strictum]
MNLLKTTAAAAVAAVVMAGAASAATCSFGNVSYTVNQGSPDAVLDKFCASGNDTNTITDSYTLFSMAGWTLGDKTDDATAGDGNVSFALFELDDDNDDGVLNWELLNPFGYQYVALTLKQANSFAAFLLDTTKPLVGTWSTSGPGNSKDGLSHGSAYYNGEPNLVPLPAAGWLLLAGIGGLAALRRKKA